MHLNNPFNQLLRSFNEVSKDYFLNIKDMEKYNTEIGLQSRVSFHFSFTSLKSINSNRNLSSKCSILIVICRLQILQLKK